MIPSLSYQSRARLAAVQHRVLIYLTCYNVLDGYVGVIVVIVLRLLFYALGWFVS
jgi:hypothetical protein